MRFLIVFFSSLFFISGWAMDYPETRRMDSTNTYHDVDVADPYQWLEDWSSSEVKTWSADQNKIARDFLDKLPNHDEIAKRVEQVVSADTVSYCAVQKFRHFDHRPVPGFPGSAIAAWSAVPFHRSAG